MQSRRVFMSKVATGLAGTLAASNVLGANDRIRLGIIGPGARGARSCVKRWLRKRRMHGRRRRLHETSGRL